EAIQRHLEQGLNHDLSRVRIHDDAEADKLAKGVNAIAFTTGTDIFFQAGQFNPNTQSGLELLAHEVTHTVQQSQGRVGKGIDPDAGLETEAQAMGSRLAQMKPVTEPLRRAPAMSRISAGLAVQRQYQTPLVFSNSQTKTALSLGGTGQAWEDAGAATQIAVQMVPARLKQQFKDMPTTLTAGLQIMVRDIALTLGVSTAVGAAIGAFFGGVGAAPGAALGFEVGQLILGAWGLAVLLPVLKSQMDSLGWSVRQFTKLSKAAAGNPQKIKQAAEALTTGIVIFCNGLLLAIGALLLKQGTAWITKSRLGTAISATSEKSASLVWLKQRQQFGATRPVAKALVDRGRALGRAKLQKEAGLLSQGLKMASSAVKGIDPPADRVRYQEAVKVGTLKYHLHPQFGAVKAELDRYGFQIRTSDHTHVVYRRLIDPKDKKQVTGVEKVLNLGPDVRFLDVLHELDHIRQLVVNLKGEVFTDTGVARQGGFKSFGNDALYRSTTLSNPQNVVTETHVRLKEYQRLRLAGADDAILAEHYEGVAHWLRQFREQTSSAKGSASNAALQDWAYTAFPDLQDLINEFQTLVSTGVDTMRLR
ncbi:eCIS core domain-containing protein, partial [Deinococcus knuensis]|uniref:eCIS core domain-containing protein n=1 Tax=Deinococcus knuensis TaxID=1837380 RepID=UPI001E316C07